MPYRSIPLVNNEYYHVYNRGVEKRNIFLDVRDHQRCLETILYYQQKEPPTRLSKTPRRCPELSISKAHSKLVEIICYMLMPNHIHFLLKQIEDNGISIFMSKFANSYTKYFNTKNKRVGSLFQGQFKAKRIENDEQLLHISRYIHLNPFVSELGKDLSKYQWSSYHEYVNEIVGICNKEIILGQFATKKDYSEFIDNHADYAQSIEIIKHTVIEE